MFVNQSYTKAEREWVSLVKQIACANCDAPGPVEGHHTKQSNAYSMAGLCSDCHRGPQGWHGDRTLMRIYKHDENDLISITVSRVYKLLRFLKP